MTRRLTTLALLASLTLPAAAGAGALDPAALWEAWPAERFVETPAPCLGPGELAAAVRELASRHPGALTVEEVGRSVQGRPIHQLTLGRGERTVLLWSQMHGDEPSATPALLDLADYLLRHADEPGPAAVLSELTLILVPMLNPDAAAAYTRRNAQAIDVNRDALNLVTPEGRLLKAIRDEIRPILGFNLHDQNRRRTAGDSGILATNAVLAVSGDEANTLTPARLRAKRAAAAVTQALAPFVPGGMARYDETFSPRAFGDNLTAWGTPVLLIESGGVPEGHPFTDLTRTNFVGILYALGELARDDLAGHDPAVYDDLPDNALGDWVDVVVRGGSIVQPGVSSPYRADVAFDIATSDQRRAGCPAPGDPVRSEIQDVGDGRFLASERDVEASDRWLLPAFDGVVDGWRARRWLDGAVLDAWAAGGVRSVAWRVPARRLESARRHAEGLRSETRPRLEVMTGTREGGLRLKGPPGPRSEATLASGLASLTGESGWTDAAIRALWPEGGTHRPVLHPGREASFLVLRPADDGSLAAATVESVWLDGIEVEGGER